MPASRSRTERWRECLQQIHQRAGGIEFSIARPEGSAPGPDVIWRVRVLAVGEKEMLVERPAAIHQPFDVAPGTKLVVVMSIGQNRWMFRSRVLGPADGPNPWQTRLAGLRLELAEKAERCPRREFMRTSTSSLSLPQVQCWPLLDPTSVVAAEAANRAAIMGENTPGGPIAMPNVGPGFTARLMNLGGGGLGLLVDKSESTKVDSSRLIWMRVDLRPWISEPLAVSGRVAHTHADSEQNLHAGIAFEFSFNAEHKDFVINQMTRCAERLQESARAAA